MRSGAIMIFRRKRENERVEQAKKQEQKKTITKTGNAY